MIQDTEFWTVVINGSANLFIASAMIVQTIIFYVTFKFGFKYLDQHKGKVRIEKNVDLTEKIIFSLHQMVGLIESYFQGTDVYSVNDFIEKKSPMEVPKEFVNTYAKLLIINKNVEEKSESINNLYSQIAVWIDFLKDHEARIFMFRLKSSHAQIVDDLYFNLMKVREESDFLHLSSEEKKKEFIRIKRREYLSFVPKSYYDSNFEGLQNYRMRLDDLKEYLIENHLP
jgi:hypothetical protein